MCANFLYIPPNDNPHKEEEREGALHTASRSVHILACVLWQYTINHISLMNETKN